MQAKDIMTKDVLFLGEEATAFEAIDLLVNNKISAAPVVDKEKNTLGIVSEKDLLVSLDFLGVKNSRDVSVKEFMTRDIVTFTESASVKEISQVLVRRNIKRVPIVKDKKIIGIVSRRDILKALRNQ